MSSSRHTALAAWTVSVLLIAVSLGGLFSSAYARELPGWRAQAVGQDWFDLLVAAPWIAVCGIGARTGSFRWRVLLAGGYAYAVYEMLIYAFAVHFNALFLVYCATLGVAGFALVATALDLTRHDIVHGHTAHAVACFLIVLGAAFGLMWLAEDVPAVLRDTPPPSLVETGLLTNPVHVIDLAFVLPLHVVAGVWLWQRRRASMALASIVLAFDVLMAASIGGMMLVMLATGAGAAVPVIVAMFVVSAIAVAALAHLLRRQQA